MHSQAVSVFIIWRAVAALAIASCNAIDKSPFFTAIVSLRYFESEFLFQLVAYGNSEFSHLAASASYWHSSLLWLSSNWIALYTIVFGNSIQNQGSTKTRLASLFPANVGTTKIVNETKG
jgi:hypothetical protein